MRKLLGLSVAALLITVAACDDELPVERTR